MSQTEELLIDWFSGRNAHGVQFECDENELNLFVNYMKALPVETVSGVLAQLLVSPYLRSLTAPRLVTDCVPKIHFRQLPVPHQETYDKLVVAFGLREFTAENCVRDFTEDVRVNGGSGDGTDPIYMCFIRFGDIYLVNLLPAINM